MKNWAKEKVPQQGALCWHFYDDELSKFTHSLQQWNIGAKIGGPPG